MRQVVQEINAIPDSIPPQRWQVAAVEALLSMPFSDLIYRAQQVHRAHFAPNQVQLSTLLSIKTGGCSEDCGYCSQSARFQTDIESQPLMSKEAVIAAAVCCAPSLRLGRR